MREGGSDRGRKEGRQGVAGGERGRQGEGECVPAHVRVCVCMRVRARLTPSIYMYVVN
jgi:hypothetical protein